MDLHLIEMAWFTRSHDGWVRQSAARELFGSPREWTVLYLVQLLGEYVVEICSDVADFVEGTVAADPVWTEAFGWFWHENPRFVELTRARARSYWNAYLRQRSVLADYPAERALKFLDELVREPG